AINAHSSQGRHATRGVCINHKFPVVRTARPDVQWPIRELFPICPIEIRTPDGHRESPLVSSDTEHDVLAISARGRIYGSASRHRHVVQIAAIRGNRRKLQGPGREICVENLVGRRPGKSLQAVGTADAGSNLARWREWRGTSETSHP